ncbi:MAG: hypothetical protein F6K39_28385 [Okeania sp. SIO3B3]|nr:hypothetical protein [Okeania sp. SIO3B3]
MNAQFLVKPRTNSSLGSFCRRRLALDLTLPTSLYFTSILSTIHPITNPEGYSAGLLAVGAKLVINSRVDICLSFKTERSSFE